MSHADRRRASPARSGAAGHPRHLDPIELLTPLDEERFWQRHDRDTAQPGCRGSSSARGFVIGCWGYDSSEERSEALRRATLRLEKHGFAVERRGRHLLVRKAG